MNVGPFFDQDQSLHRALMQVNPEYRAAVEKRRQAIAGMTTAPEDGPKPIKHSDFSPRDEEEERLRLYLRDHMEAAEMREAAKPFVSQAMIDFVEAHNPFLQRLKAARPGPYADYFATLRREREERLGRLETVSPEPARPAGADADGRRETIARAQALCGGPDRRQRPGDAGSWSC